MNYGEIFENIKKKRSFLCIGLDTDIKKIPSHLLKSNDPVFEFNKQIIDATIDLTVAYKPNIAFYESHGSGGWKSLERTIEYLGNFKNEVFTIADAKRGDIGNTSERYARAFLAPKPDGLGFDAITVAPYMGEDSVKPFLKISGKWAILLALTSNQGAFDFQFLKNADDGKYLFESVIEKSLQWGSKENLMYVVGATKAEMLKNIRQIIPDHFLLIPGIGTQGGSLENVANHGMNKNCGLLVNSSRSIIYASAGKDFADKAREKAFKLQKKMEQIMLSEKIIIQ